MKQKIVIFLLVASSLINAYDVTLVGPVKFADGIGRQVISFSECLQDLSVNIIPTREVDVQDVPESVLRRIDFDGTQYGDVLLFADTLDNFPCALRDCPSVLKIAYTMFEKTALPGEWVTILNDNFDMAVVPDEFLVDVYKNSGVTIPLFVLPIPLYLEPFLDAPAKWFANKPFVFGTSGTFTDRKNHELLLESFAQAFGNNPDVFLKIHGRAGKDAEKIKQRIVDLNLNNVAVLDISLSWQEYIEYVKSLDCYVLLSRGEGFSITPREALAAGIPCVITDNTGHHTLCQSGYVFPVPCYKVESSRTYNEFSPYDFDALISDVIAALKNVYTSFWGYLKDSIFGRAWVKKYLRSSLKGKYSSMAKPSSVVVGPYNKISKYFVMTNSNELYEKYKKIKQETFSFWPF